MTLEALCDQGRQLLRDIPHGDELAVELYPAVPSIRVRIGNYLSRDDAMEVLAHLTDRIAVDTETDGLITGRFDGDVVVLVTWPAAAVAA